MDRHSMVNRLDGSIGSIVDRLDRSNSERLRAFGHNRKHWAMSPILYKEAIGLIAPCFRK